MFYVCINANDLGQAMAILTLPRNGERSVFATDAFRKDLESFKSYSQKDIVARLEEFIAFKIENGMQPMGTKDAPIGFHNKGVWRYHLDHGKVILLYAPTDTHIELYMIRDHTIMDGATATNIIHRYVTGVTEDKLTAWARRNQSAAPAFSPQDLDEVEMWVMSMLDNADDREMLREFANGQEGDFSEFLVGFLTEKNPDIEDALATFLAQFEVSRRLPLSRYLAHAIG